MAIKVFRYLIIALLSLSVFSIAYAEIETTEIQAPQKQCAELVKECFAATNLARSNCLFSSTKHPFCEGTQLGKLVYRRWIILPARPVGVEAPPAFLGPQLIDKQCIENFDNKLLSTLIEAKFSKEKLSQLDEHLVSCTKEISENLTRP